MPYSGAPLAAAAPGVPLPKKKPLFYVPLSSLSHDQFRRWVDRRIKQNMEMAKRERERRERTLDEEIRLRDTKPLIYVSKDGEWPIVVVGAGQVYRNDLKEMAERRREKARYRTDDGLPRIKFPDPNVTLRTAVDQFNRGAIGLKVFHIPGNPCART